MSRHLFPLIAIAIITMGAGPSGADLAAEYEEYCAWLLEQAAEDPTNDGLVILTEAMAAVPGEWDLGRVHHADISAIIDGRWSRQAWSNIEELVQSHRRANTILQRLPDAGIISIPDPMRHGLPPNLNLEDTVHHMIALSLCEARRQQASSDADVALESALRIAETCEALMNADGNETVYSSTARAQFIASLRVVSSTLRHIRVTDQVASQTLARLIEMENRMGEFNDRWRRGVEDEMEELRAIAASETLREQWLDEYRMISRVVMQTLLDGIVEFSARVAKQQSRLDDLSPQRRAEVDLVSQMLQDLEQVAPELEASIEEGIRELDRILDDFPEFERRQRMLIVSVEEALAKPRDQQVMMNKEWIEEITGSELTLTAVIPYEGILTQITRSEVPRSSLSPEVRHLCGDSINFASILHQRDIASIRLAQALCHLRLGDEEAAEAIIDPFTDEPIMITERAVRSVGMDGLTFTDDDIMLMR